MLYKFLVDLWKNKHLDKNGFTWCNVDNCLKSGIDYVFVSSEILDSTKNIIIRSISSTHNKHTRICNHRYLKTYADFNKLERGSEYWKLNISHFDTKNK